MPPEKKTPQREKQRLSDEIKTEIVRRLAQWERPTEVAKAVNQMFGCDVSVQLVWQYDPTKAGFTAGDEWREKFTAWRKAATEDVSAIPVSHQSYRLSLLQRGIADAESKGNYVLAAKLAQQAAEELGGVFTNARQVAHSGSVGRHNLTPEDARAELLARAEAARERAAGATQH